MRNGLSKDQKARFDELYRVLMDLESEVVSTQADVIVEVEKVMDSAFGKFTDVVNEYNEARNSMWAFCEEIASEMEHYYEDRSDSWREGDRGQEFYERMQVWISACGALDYSSFFVPEDWSECDCSDRMGWIDEWEPADSTFLDDVEKDW